MKTTVFTNQQIQDLKKSVNIMILGIITALFLNGCEQSNTPTPVIKKPVKKYSKTTLLKGIVSDDEKKITTGLIKATNNNNEVIATTELQNNNRFSIEIPGGTNLPIILTYFPTEKSSDAEQLVAVAVDPFIKNYDITPRTTAIANTAKSLGGYSHSNLVQAANSAVNAPGRNRTSATFRGDPTKQYGGWH